MTDLRENLNWIIGSAFTALAIVIGWLVQSGIAVALISVLIGASSSYFITSRTQKRAWKREYAIKVVETIYAPLFTGLKEIMRILEAKIYVYCELGAWLEIQNSYKYLMLDKPFRARLDLFSAALKKYSLAIGKVRYEILPKIFNAEAKEFFNLRRMFVSTFVSNAWVLFESDIGGKQGILKGKKEYICKGCLPYMKRPKKSQSMLQPTRSTHSAQSSSVS